MDIENMDDEQIIDLIVQCAQELGWHIALPVGEEQDVVEGLVLGTEGYIEAVLGKQDEHNANNETRH